MRSYGNELQVQQGEDFNLDLTLYANVQKKIPFIVSEARRHPFWTITVASTKFEKNLRYVKTWWNEYIGPQFAETNPVFYGDLSPTPPSADRDFGDRDETPTAFDYSTGEQPGGDGIPTVKIGYSGTLNIDYYIDSKNAPNIYEVIIDDETYYYKFNYTTLELEELTTTIVIPEHPSDDPTNPTYNDYIHKSLYYYTINGEEVDPSTTEKPRYYFYYNYSSPTSSTLVRGYECHIRQNFLTEETQEWSGQNYMYQITLVDGDYMYQVLNALYEAKSQNNDLSDYPLDKFGNWISTKAQQETISDEGNDIKLIQRRYEYFKIRWPNAFQSDIDSDSPLGNIQVPIPILNPTKLEVYNNLRRLI